MDATSGGPEGTAGPGTGLSTAGLETPGNAPVIHVRGLAYKGAVEVTTRPPGRRALPQ